MKNVTISMPEDQLEAVRRIAEVQKTTFNDLVREWSAAYVAKQEAARRTELLGNLERSLRLTKGFKLDRKYTREEMNQR